MRYIQCNRSDGHAWIGGVVFVEVMSVDINIVMKKRSGSVTTRH